MDNNPEMETAINPVTFLLLLLFFQISHRDWIRTEYWKWALGTPFFYPFYINRSQYVPSSQREHRSIVSTHPTHTTKTCSKERENTKGLN